MIGIYKIVSPSGNIYIYIYIGQSIDINRRFNTYKKNGAKKQNKLNSSFIKYGVEYHTFEIIEECNEFELNVKERYWQDYYNVLEEGLNLLLTKTYNKSGKVSNKTKQKSSISHSGIKQSPELIKKRTAHQIGVPRTDETKRKIRNSLLGKKRPQEVIEKIKGYKHTEESIEKMKKSRGPHKNPRKPYKREKCNVCGKEASITHIHRLHNNNCKSIKQF